MRSLYSLWAIVEYNLLYILKKMELNEENKVEEKEELIIWPLQSGLGAEE